MPPGAKKSWRLGRCSGGAGVIGMGVVVDTTIDSIIVRILLR